jgi:hypothetical protein
MMLRLAVRSALGLVLSSFSGLPATAPAAYQGALELSSSKQPTVAVPGEAAGVVVVVLSVVEVAVVVATCRPACL